jgi:anaerobic selenocysteine-containing dehydrogenase
MRAVAELTSVPGQAGRHGRVCPLCEAMCGLTVDVDAAAAIGSVRGDQDDPWSRGYLCPKGASLGRLHDDPDRLRVPLIRTADGWREASFDDAYARCEELISGVLDRHGKDAFTCFVGNPTMHSIALSRYVGVLAASFHHIYSTGTVDAWPKNVTATLMFGNAYLFPVPDVPRTDYFLCLGANPSASNGSLIALPDFVGEIDRVRARGGRVAVVDPRRTGTSNHADEWIGIQPGTDAAWLLAVLHVLFAENLVDLGTVADLVDGVEVVRDLVRAFPPESVEEFTRVPAATTRRIARELAAAPTAAVYGRIGLCTQEFGTLATWLVDVLAICTGNLDKPGGSMFARPIGLPPSWLTSTKAAGLPEFGRWRAHGTDVPEILGQVPASCLAEEILAPGSGQIRGLFTSAANPVISVPGSDRLDVALADLECMISLDAYVNETTRHAHVILPAPSPLELPHLDNLSPAWAVRSAARWSEPVLPLPPQMREEWESIVLLAGLLGGTKLADIDIDAVDDGYFAVLCSVTGIDPQVAAAATTLRGPRRIADWEIRVGAFGDRYGDRPDGWNLERLQAHPHGVDLGPMIPRAREAVCTPTGRIELAPEYLLTDLPRLAARISAGAPTGPVLVSRRHVRSNNSWLHNVDSLMRGRDRCTLLVSPDDAAAYGLHDSGYARVTSDAATVDVLVEVTDEMLPGVVCLPHGWGHDKPGMRMSVASASPGVNNNRLAPVELRDALSGNAAVNGIPVQLAPAISVSSTGVVAAAAFPAGATRSR